MSLLVAVGIAVVTCIAVLGITLIVMTITSSWRG